MGEDKPGRARGYGVGVTKSQVTGFRARVKRMRNEETGYIDPTTQIQKLQAIVAQQQRMMTKTSKEVAQLKDEVQIYRTALGAFSGDVTCSPSTQGVHMFGSRTREQEKVPRVQGLVDRSSGPSSSIPVDRNELGTLTNLNVRLMRQGSSSEVYVPVNDTNRVAADQLQINENTLQSDENAVFKGPSELNISSSNARLDHSRQGQQ